MSTLTAEMVNSRTDLRSIARQLEAARSQIEERFVEGGQALMAAHDLIAELLAAIDGVAGALDGSSCEIATQRLTATLNGLAELAKAEGAARSRLVHLLDDGVGITPRIDDMQRSLNYLNTCAMETRIAGAGVPEFVQFADDVNKYVGSAIGQVKVFAQKVGTLTEQIAAACSAKDFASGVSERVPTVSNTLMSALRAVKDRREAQRRMATDATKVALAVQEKVAKVLSALQIGDVTRQRIEHVQAGIAILEEQIADCASPRQAEALAAVGTRLFAAQTSALIKDFTDQTRIVVASIDGLSSEASRILSLTSRGGHGNGEAMQAIEHGVGLARSVVEAIEHSSRHMVTVYDATRQVATELLSNMGSIGNLRSVRDDIRCLAINAYLRSNRLGPKGRAVGVVAAEMNTYAARLGVAAEDILGRLSTMRESTRAVDAGKAGGGDLVGELDGTVASLREVNMRMATFLAETEDNGHRVAERIGHIARDIDFRKDLGEHLEACRRLFGGNDDLTPVSHAEEFAAFSERLMPIYTMAAERTVHNAILRSGGSTLAAPVAAPAATSSADDFDDVLF